VTRRCWLLIDTDPSRPTGISSTDDEHEAALAKAHTIRAYLSSRGWSEPIFADSGNGAHLLYAIDLSNDDEARLLIERLLRGLASRFDDSATASSTPTIGAMPWRAQAAWKRTTPASDMWSVSAKALMPSAAARATNASGASAPRKKLNALAACNST
jgi:hypothetical protein